MTTILAATAGLTILISEGLGRGSDGGDQVITNPNATVSTSTTTSTATSAVPDSAATVTGTITALHLEGAVVDPREITTPLTVIADRGFGNGGRITGVLVDGTPATIEWDAGRPFVLSSGGAMVLDPVRMDLTPEGIRLNLADAVHLFTAGNYHLDTPVAVGTSGVAGARESVVFSATAESRFEARGDAALFLDAARPRHLLGPGVVHLEGTLEISDATGKRTVGRVDAAEGAFDVTLTPVAGGGWTVRALLGGELTTG
jgi:hypothetical protein